MKQIHQFSPQDLAPALDYIDGYWQTLKRFNRHDEGSLIGLPKPYIVPSYTDKARFNFSEMYYWDSYFISQGLYGTANQKFAENMLENMLDMVRRFGSVPNGSRYYLMGRSQPPFLTSFILEVYANADKSTDWLSEAMTQAKLEYQKVWMGVVHPNWRKVYRGLSRYYDINILDDLAEAESGWDYNGRFNGQCLDYVPIDLNCLLYKYEKDFEAAAEMLGDSEEAEVWHRRARQRKTTINKLMWDEAKGFYFDYNYLTGRRSRVWSLAGYYALWAGVATREQARRMEQQLERFEKAGGLVTTDRPSLNDPRELPLQWDYPNGWAPLQYLVVTGLVSYHYREEADRIVRKWLAANLIQFNQRGIFYEKYNVVQPHQPPLEGVYPSQTGFGWTNSIFSLFARTYLRPDELPEAVKPNRLKSLLRTGS